MQALTNCVSKCTKYARHNEGGAYVRETPPQKHTASGAKKEQPNSSQSEHERHAIAQRACALGSASGARPELPDMLLLRFMHVLQYCTKGNYPGGLHLCDSFARRHRIWRRARARAR